MTYNDGRDEHSQSPGLIALWALLAMFTAGVLGGLILGAVLWMR